ncbi:MAG: hypothetical protein D3909_18025 [Candidatus Electrothrix sp. ATG1]|nr:hypothetical protein [Candidatus Electrothrix sp. ATG1]
MRTGRVKSKTFLVPKHEKMGVGLVIGALLCLAVSEAGVRSACVSTQEVVRRELDQWWWSNGRVFHLVSKNRKNAFGEINASQPNRALNSGVSGGI